MPISKENLPQTSGSTVTVRTKPRSSRPSGIAGSIPSSSRPSGIDGRTYTEAATLSDEMGYGRIVKIVKAIQR